jgi:hypothetical protein
VATNTRACGFTVKLFGIQVVSASWSAFFDAAEDGRTTNKESAGGACQNEV